jgi:hypothetical protein
MGPKAGDEIHVAVYDVAEAGVASRSAIASRLEEGMVDRVVGEGACRCNGRGRGRGAAGRRSCGAGEGGCHGHGGSSAGPGSVSMRSYSVGRTYADWVWPTLFLLLHAEAPRPPPTAAASTTTVASAKERKHVGLRSPQIVRRSGADGSFWLKDLLYCPGLEASIPSNPATSGASENLV